MSAERQFIRSSDGASCELRIFRAQQAAAPVLLFMPAMGVAQSYYEPLGQAAVRQGLNAVVGELRGNGTSSVRAGRGTDFGYYDLLTWDWPVAVQRTRELFPSSPLLLGGHSLGGQLSCLYAALHPAELSGLVLIASCSVHYRLWPKPRRWALLAMTQLTPGVSRLFGHFPGRAFRFAGREARGVMADWARQSRTGRYQPSGCPHDLEQALSQVSLPTLAISVAGDDFAPQAAIDGLCAKLRGAPIERWRYDPASFGKAPADHFRWVRDPEAVLSRVAEWANRCLRPLAPVKSPPPNADRLG